ncbi:MAG: FAD-dependent oxidoreductase [Rhodobacteraceae bacterium]|nr:MAG: FAD-dependent oxidoreductase [Paracoccaceae bacterium]
MPDGGTFDVIVVGAGPAGCVLAHRLSADAGRRVLVLEAGRGAPEASDMPAMWISLVNTEIDWGYHTVPQAGCKMRRIFWPRGKALGGSSAINAMIYIRGLPSDYDGWEASGCPGWGWRDVLPVFRKSEHNERLSNDPLHGAGGPLNIADVPHVDPTERLRAFGDGNTPQKHRRLVEAMPGRGGLRRLRCGRLWLGCDGHRLQGAGHRDGGLPAVVVVVAQGSRMITPAPGHPARVI